MEPDIDILAIRTPLTSSRRRPKNAHTRILIAAEDRAAVCAAPRHARLPQSRHPPRRQIPLPAAVRLTGASPGALFLQQDVKGDQHSSSSSGGSRKPTARGCSRPGGEGMGACHDGRSQRRGQVNFQSGRSGYGTAPAPYRPPLRVVGRGRCQLAVSRISRKLSRAGFSAASRRSSTSRRTTRRSSDTGAL